MTAICPTPIHFCKVRVTRLNVDGTVAAAPNNHVVSQYPASLQVDPDVLAGTESNLVGGCDCLAATYRGKDKLMRMNLTLQMTDVEPALVELLTGGAVVTAANGDLIGNSFPTQTDCSSAGQPPVAIEGWQDNWQGDRQALTPYQYTRWTFRMSFWQWDTFTLQNDFLQPTFKGYTRSNPNFTSAAYNDWPSGASLTNFGGYFFDSVQPAAYCGYSPVST
jgi:hypothetical protein